VYHILVYFEEDNWIHDETGQPKFGRRIITEYYIIKIQRSNLKNCFPRYYFHLYLYLFASVSTLNPQQEILLQKFNYISTLISEKVSIIQNELLQNIRGRVSKKATNESKTAVMNVIGFLCVSLGISFMTV
jgi:hypothetical protein